MKIDIIEALRDLKKDDVDWTAGKCFGYVYDPGLEARRLLEETFLLYMNDTVLDTQAFPSARLLERSVAEFAVELLKGPDTATASFTSGGTESIIMSVLAHREWAREEKGVDKPNIVLADTAHPAFNKACFYLGVRPIVVAAGPDYRADFKKMEYYSDDNTIMIVGSAPAYGVGQVDPLREMGEFAKNANIGFVVDACVGGGILPFLEEGGLSFDLPGVTAITLDWHKWFMAPKGASSVVYRDKKMLRYQTFAHSAWMGYPIVNPTMTSTRSTAHVACTHAILNHFGLEGYREITQGIMNTASKIKDFFRGCEQLSLVGDPSLNVFSVYSLDPEVNIFRIQEALRGRGWFIQPQTGFGDMPPSCHISVTRGNIGQEDDFIAAIQDILETVNLRKSTQYDKINELPIRKRDEVFKDTRIFKPKET